MEPIIEFENFTFKYRSQMEPTLRDINLKIYPGEKVLIIGPSGSGKSTLSNCINGLIPFSYEGDSTGTLRIEGKDPKKLGIFGLSKMVGTVLQDTDGQFIGLTVAEDIAFVLENDCMAQEEMFRKVDGVAETVEVKELLSHAPSEMSGGQKQRVSMAGVMIDDVDILLFDEPLANLDPATGKKAIALIDRIQKEQKKTIVIIEHRLEDVLYKDVDRIVVVGDGTIVADMKPDDLLVGNILEEQGIREPLYVTALKHAGCTITAQDHPQHVETMNFEPYKTQVREWFETTQIPQKQETQEKVLKVDHLHFSYQPEKAILSDISFDVKKGEMISIVGKNGAGKTTLSNLICGFLEPSKGKIELNGNDISPLSVKERGEHIGIVMQNPNQMISKPMIYEEVALGLTVRGVPEEEIRERVHETLKICGLYQFRNWPVSALSFGQKKRVTIASILVMKPEILILDEPTAGLDPGERIRFRNIISNIAKNRMVLISTHIVSDIEYIANQVVILQEGKLNRMGTVEGLCNDIQGSVWKVNVDEMTAEELMKNYLTSNIKRVDENVLMRIISKNKPIKNARMSEPQLEDVFLTVFCEQAGI